MYCSVNFSPVEKVFGTEHSGCLQLPRLSFGGLIFSERLLIFDTLKTKPWDNPSARVVNTASWPRPSKVWQVGSCVSVLSTRISRLHSTTHCSGTSARTGAMGAMKLACPAHRCTLHARAVQSYIVDAGSLTASTAAVDENLSGSKAQLTVKLKQCIHERCKEMAHTQNTSSPFHTQCVHTCAKQF